MHRAHSLLFNVREASSIGQLPVRVPSRVFYSISSLFFSESCFAEDFLVSGHQKSSVNTRFFHSWRISYSQPTPPSTHAFLFHRVWVPDATSDFDDDAVECFTQATGMIFIYVVVWQVRLNLVCR